MILLAHYK